jgi:ATP-dependent helicase HrpA
MDAPRPLPPLEYPPELPISQRRDEIVTALRAHRVVVICGETGSGKTTQLPKMLIEAGALGRGAIGHTQPRRIAARSVAARLTAELKGAPPQFVGHKVRFNDGTARDTAIKVMTDGILLAEARHDPLLRRYDALIIDEAHERSLNIDFLLGFLKRLLPRRPDLRLVITSATIDPASFSKFFGDAPVIEVSGRTYPVETRYRPLEADPEDRFDPGLTTGILAAIEEIHSEPGEIGHGDILVFLPGEREIREAAEAIEQAHGSRLTVLPLYSRLAWTDQQKVFDRRGPRRVVLATNVAETSLTVPGIRSVIDAGLARIARYSLRTKLLRLPIEPISQASANQRQGRCGRVGPGLCIRLYAEEDYAARAPFTPPEVLRTNLANVILQMEVLGLGAPVDFPFLDPPDTRLINDGYRLLQELEAVDGQQRVTETGRTMARMPVDPRLARMMLAGRRAGALREVLSLVAALSIQDPRERPADRQTAADAAHAALADPQSDFMTLLALRARYQAERTTRSRNALRRWCADAFLSASRMREWEDLETQLEAVAADLDWPLNETPATAENIHRAILSGLLGQVGAKTERGDFLGARGRRFLIAPGTPLKNRSPRWVMAAQIVETQRIYARCVAAIEPAWVEVAARHLVKREYTEPEWDAVRGVVGCRESVTLYGLALVAGRRTNYGAVAPEAARDILVREALVHRHSTLRARFLDQNATLKARLRAEQAALRRDVILVDEEGEAAFYTARIPSAAHSIAGFERWRRDAERARPDLLCMQESDLRLPDAPVVDRGAYPEQLVLAGNRLPIEYLHDPNAPADGATVRIPEALLPKLTGGELDWGIPGWLEDKVTALIRGLPKGLRRQLVPAPDVARRALSALTARRGAAFVPSLAAVLTEVGGEPIPVAALEAVALPDYLRLNVRVFDAEGRVVGEGRDLAALARKRRRAGRDQPTPTSSGDPWTRGDVRRFDFGVLPEMVRVERQGVQLDLYPALEDRGEHASLSLLVDAADAAAVTRRGMVRLLALELATPLRNAEKLVASDRDLMLLHQPVGTARPFARNLVERALERECLPPGIAVPRDTAAFTAAAERGRPTLVAAAERVAKVQKAALTELRQVRAELAALPENLDGELVADVRAQLLGLVYEGYVAATPDPWLDSLERFLKALRRRAQKLRDPKPITVAAQWDYHQLRRRYRALLTRIDAGDRPPPAVVDLRWWLEEYGVQLFAQDLRTSVPVSAKRLEGAFTTAEVALGPR